MGTCRLVALAVVICASAGCAIRQAPTLDIQTAYDPTEDSLADSLTREQRLALESIEKELRKVPGSGACKIDAALPAYVAEREVVLQCVGNDKFQNSVVKAIRSAPGPLPPFRTIAYSKRFRDVLAWGEVNGRPVHLFLPTVTECAVEDLPRSAAVTTGQPGAGHQAKAPAKSTGHELPVADRATPAQPVGRASDPRQATHRRPVDPSSAQPQKVSLASSAPTTPAVPEESGPSVPLRLPVALNWRPLRSHVETWTQAQFDTEILTAGQVVVLDKVPVKPSPSDLRQYGQPHVLLLEFSDSDGEGWLVVTPPYPSVEMATEFAESTPWSLVEALPVTTIEKLTQLGVQG